MKKIIIVVITLTLVQVSCATKAGRQSIEGKVTIYVGGLYLDHDEQKACYWIDGKRYEIDGESVDYIAVADGKVYTTGTYRDYSKPSEYYPWNSWTRFGCYWIDGIRYELLDFSVIRDIYVDNDNVYILGNTRINRDEFKPGYWANGIYQSLPEPDGDSYAVDLKVVNGVVYAAGWYFVDDYPYYACYWVNGIRKELPNSEGFSAFGIEVINDRIFIGASNQRGLICYWIDGEQYLISDPGNTEYGHNAFAVFNEDVYIYASEGESYWINSTRHELPEAPQRQGNPDDIKGRAVYNYTIINGKIYVTGRDWDHNNSIAWYWLDGQYHFLNGYAAISIFVVEE